MTLVILLLAACGGGVPADQQPVIADADRAYGKEAHPQLLAEFGGAYSGDEAAYVRDLGERIARAANLEGHCTFTLVNSDVVNAFAVPGCYIYVTRGLVAIVTSEAELASVLGHEVGHIVARHAQRQQRREAWRTVGVIAASLTGSEGLTRLASQAGQLFGLRYSRKQEYEADDLGVRYLRNAGYDVFAATDMLAALQRNSDFITRTGRQDEARSLPEWALSHPLTERRIERARQSAEKTGLRDDEFPEDAERYLASVDGLLYGDDPEQGFVIERRFAHPRMRISFEAPKGFSLTNSPQAIRLSGPAGASGEFSGGRLGGASLKNYAETLADRVVGRAPAQVTRAQATEINGVNSVLLNIRVATRDGSVKLALAAYDGGNGQAYHFIIASPPGADNAAATEALLRSFRRLSPAEAAALRPRIIRTVKAGPGDTTEKLAGRVVDPSPKALFTLLNGRTANRPTRPGEIVKIVTYPVAR